MTSAVAEIPLCSAIQPAFRPISSTTMTRSWLSAVVCSLSIASVAVLTAVSKPKVTWVPTTSLSMVLGTPTTGSPFFQQVVRDLQAAVAADGDQRVEAAGAERRDQVVGAVHLGRGPSGCGVGPAERIAPVGGAEDGAAEMGDAADVRRGERHDAVVAEQAAVAALDAVALPAALVGGEHHGPDDGVESRGVAAAGGDGDTHGGQPCASRTRRSTSPGSACRLSAFFENTSCPSTVTSKTPPEDSTSWTSASGKAVLELGRQTGGPWAVVSDDAELDHEFHAIVPGQGVEARGATCVNRSAERRAFQAAGACHCPLDESVSMKADAHLRAGAPAPSCLAPDSSRSRFMRSGERTSWNWAPPQPSPPLPASPTSTGDSAGRVRLGLWLAVQLRHRDRGHELVTGRRPPAPP